MRRILHIDADAFFAAVEQRDFPHLRGKPVAVGGDYARGVLTTASYEARRYGVGSAMPSRMAKERCPGLIIVPPRFEVYRDVARQMREIFARYTDLIEPLSIDEAFLDVTNPLRGPKSGTLIAQLIRTDIYRETGLTVTAGVSYCKFLAKLASGMDKPDGLTVIVREEADAILERLPVERIHGVGPRTTVKLHDMGIRTGGDLRARSEEELVARFGKVGAHYHRLAHGIDDRPVDPAVERKSVSSEETFATDFDSLEELERELPALAEDVARRLGRSGASGRGVAVKIKYADHTIVTRQQVTPLPVSTGAQIFEAARTILWEKFQLEQPVRLLGVGVYDLIEGEPVQAPLFPDLNWAAAGVSASR